MESEKSEVTGTTDGDGQGYSFDELSNQVIGAALQVHKRLGPGFMETIYEEALKIELRSRGLMFESQKTIRVLYEDQVVGNHVLDLVVEGLLVVELKAIKALEPVHFAQLRSYLRATRLRVGLLMNFNAPTLVVKREVC